MSDSLREIVLIEYGITFYFTNLAHPRCNRLERRKPYKTAGLGNLCVCL